MSTPTSKVPVGQKLVLQFATLHSANFGSTGTGTLGPVNIVDDTVFSGVVTSMLALLNAVRAEAVQYAIPDGAAVLTSGLTPCWQDLSPAVGTTYTLSMSVYGQLFPL